MNSSKSFGKQLIFSSLKHYTVMLMCCLFMAQCANTKPAPKKEGGGKAIIPKINKVVAAPKEAMTLVSAKATGYRTIEIELSHELTQEQAANFAAYKIQAEKNDNPGVKDLKVIAVKVSAPKKLELTLSKRLLSMKYTLTITNLESDTAILEQGSQEIIPSGSRMVFVSEAVADGNLRNLMSPPSTLQGYEVPNVLCQAEADKHGLLGKYTALFLHPKLKEEHADDYQFLNAMTDYVRADGAGQANIGMVNSEVHSSFSLPIDVMANGQLVPYVFDGEEGTQESFIAFTGFNSSYPDLEDDMCGDDEIWNTPNEYSVTGSILRSKVPLFVFGAFETANCEEKARIICLQSASAVESDSLVWSAGEDGQSYAGDNYMFVSSINVGANMEQSLSEQGLDASVSGLKAADAICSNLVKKAAEDTTNKLSSSARASFKKNHMHYIAVLSGQEDDEDKNAKDRFAAAAYAAGAYHLPNGVKLVDELKNFFDPQTGLFAPVTVTEQGAYVALQNKHLSEEDDDYDDILEEVEREIYHNLVFTGSNTAGEILEDATCDSWTSSEEDAEVSLGFALDSYVRLSFEAMEDYNSEANFSSLPGCSMKLKLYCAYNKPEA
ncbi:MAG TPA: hypothetical protein PKC21_05120 [Oligoflexia bacterium]|nr:hypothetical protein [Oligoflexia bacterium]HMR24717.1 hypothetical protein [Oligoflexia bacterium]